MSTTLALSDLVVAAGPRTLVDGLDLVVADGDVVALVGPNGSGKSTLLRTLVGELPLESGAVRLSPADATLGWLPQVPPDPAESLRDYARRRTGVAAADARLEAAADALAAGSPGADAEYADVLERWLGLGAADLDERLPEVASRSGLDVDPDRPLGSLSGGQAARATLVAVLLSRHDVLLLDEPTNDLDARGTALVEEVVAGHRGPVLVASHDRAFLDAVATRVVELDLPQGTVHHHAGGWSAYAEERALRRRQAWEAYEQYAGERDHLEQQARQRAGWAERGRRSVALGLKGSDDKHAREKFRARADRQGARSARLSRAAERLDVVEQPRKEWQLRYSLAAGPESAEVVATLDAAVLERGDFRLGPVDLVLARGERLALAGDNGSGKSTLLAGLLGTLAPVSGRQALGGRVRVGVVDQRRRLLETDDPVVEVVRRELADGASTAPDRGEVRTLLAKFGLGAEHVDRPSRSLSLGERTRALLAVFQARAVNLLVLDEPTNHLDVAAVEQLEAAVAGFDGTLVVVSHDRRFLEEVGVDRRVTLAGGRVVADDVLR
ncbi:ABC-F family ATP-binding cassette domain-containing protein [Nocardioides sp. GCM10027113]|uniref:ABC-F family ATP-binding cassette domain-containing protein n=1 Tax=unclassified Nocardioides TaxID=2615069 RepID=UPI00361E8A1C